MKHQKAGKGGRYGVPEPGTVKSGRITADAHGAQKPLGQMSLKPRAGASEAMQRSNSGRKTGR